MSVTTPQLRPHRLLPAIRPSRRKKRKITRTKNGPCRRQNCVRTSVALAYEALGILGQPGRAGPRRPLPEPTDARQAILGSHSFLTLAFCFIAEGGLNLREGRFSLIVQKVDTLDLWRVGWDLCPGMVVVTGHNDLRVGLVFPTVPQGVAQGIDSDQFDLESSLEGEYIITRLACLSNLLVKLF